MLSCKSQQQLPNANENRSSLNESKDQYRREIDNRTSTLTTPNPLTTHPYMANRFQHMSHSMPETTNTCCGNSCFTNCMYHGTQYRRHTYHTAQFRSLNAVQGQQGCHHRGSPQSNNWFYSTSSCEYSNIVFHTSNITANNPETPPYTRQIVYNDNLLLSIMIEQTIIKAALSSIDMFDGEKNKFEIGENP